ncbi:MAG: TonB-dependent receptor [Elusimicrobia bacterium]|nr:TonB-dependent receptor [Elusimicrobiota bacterium]
MRRPRPSILTLTGALLVLGTCFAFAEEGTGEFWDFMGEEARNLTVASPIPENVFDSVSNVTVIDRNAIEHYNFGSVSEALRTVPGMTVTRTYTIHNVPTARGALQEHYANKVLVMVDNVPMWNAVTGEGDLDRVDIDSVERIEVLLGPASVLYGSNALTGAVNIVLRKARTEGSIGQVGGGLGSGAGVYGGALGVSRAGGSYAWKGKDASYMFSANSRDAVQPSIAFRDETGLQHSVREYLNARTLNFSAAAGGNSLLVNAFRSDQNFLGNAISLASGELFNEAKEGAVASYSYTFAPGWGDLKYSAAYDWQRRNIPRDSSNKLRSDIVGARLSNTLSAVAPLGGGFYLESGATYEYRSAQRYLNYDSNTGTPRDDNSMNARGSRESSLYAQLGREAGDWKFLAGSRYTKDSKAGDNLSSRASVIRRFGDRDSLKAMFSQSFRSPTPFEQYFLTSTVTVVGNPDLRPERTETTELSYLTAFGPLFFHLTAYHAHYIDTIYRNRGDFTRDGVSYPNANHYQNAPGFAADGLELTARYAVPATSAFLTLSRLRGTRGDEHPIPASGSLPASASWNFKYSPDYTASGGISHEFGSFFAAGNFNLLGRSRSLRTALGSQFWADLSAGYHKGPVRHTISVRDVTDREVQVPEYVRLRVVETLPLYTGRRLEYTFDYRF